MGLSPSIDAPICDAVRSTGLKMRRLAVFAFLGVLAVLPAHAVDAPSYVLTIRDHVFEPSELQVPAGEKIELRVINQDTIAEEFASPDLPNGRVIPGSAEASIWVGPLVPGSYAFLGDFHPRSAHGHLIAR
jgi:hypothetical protein